jgi:transposase-like protein
MQDKQRVWSAHVQAWQSSGDTQAAYCRAHGLSLASFGYWRRKLAGHAQPAPALLPIRVAPAVQEASVQVRLPGGIVLGVAAADPAWLANLLRLLTPC